MEPTGRRNEEEGDVKSTRQEESLSKKEGRRRPRPRGKRSCNAQLSASQEDVAHLWRAARLAPAPGDGVQAILTPAKGREPVSRRSTDVSNIDNTRSSKATELSTFSYKLRSRTGHKSHDYVVEDTYIFCHWCKALCEGVCPDHPPLLVLDRKIPRDGSRSDRARETTPWPLRVAESPIAGAGMGVFTLARLPPGLVFGPYEGQIRADQQESGYAWQVRSPSHKKKTVDSVDASVSNWMRYVNCSKTDMEANLEAFQFLGNIYYLVIKYIEVNLELLVWYGDDYGKALQSRREAEAGVHMADDHENSPDKKKIKTEDVAEVHGKTLSLSQREMEPLFTPVILKRTPDGSAQVQIAASETPDCGLPSRCSSKKAHQQYRKFDSTYCVVCRRAFRGICSKHPMPLLRDAPVPRDGSVKERARLTAPWPLVVRQSQQKAAGEGVVTTARLPKGLVLGPCEGWVLPRTSVTTGYSWEIDGRPDVEIDAADTAFSNWPRYLNCPKRGREQNLRPMQIRGEIFYVTTAEIEQNTELLVWYGDDYGSWLTFPQLLPVDGNDRLGATRGTRQRGHSTRKRTHSQTCARDRELRRQDETRGGAMETTERPTKGPSHRRRETSAEDNRRKIFRVRCPSGYASIVELSLEKTGNKRRGVALRAGASTEGIPSCWNLQPNATHGFPVAFSAEAACDKCLGDSRFKAYPGTRVMFSISSIDNREFSPQKPVKEASPANTYSVREVFPRRREDTCIVGSPAGASHQSFIGYSNLQEQKLKVEWTEDLYTSSSAKLRLPSESKSAGESLDIQRILPEEKVREPVLAQSPEGSLYTNLPEYFQSHIKALPLPGNYARTHQYISGHHYKVKHLSDYVPDITQACGPQSDELNIYECSYCHSLFALKYNLSFHLHKCLESFPGIRF